jgi:hypothetical protein
MPRTQKHINMANTVRICINFDYKTTDTKLDIKEPLLRSNSGVGDYSVASHWCENAVLMMAGELRPTEEVPRGCNNEKRPNPTVLQ